MQLALGANIENRHRNRCRKENRNVHNNCAQPAALRRPGGWMQKNAQKSKQQVGKVRHQMPGGLELNGKWKLAAPDCGQQLLARLDRPLGPAMLLRLEAVHVHRQLGRSDDICEIDKSPTLKLGAIAKVEVLTQCVSLPAS